MAYLTANIDRAIVLTQFELRGFMHPLGVRCGPYSNHKNFDALTANFVAIAAGLGDYGGRRPTDPTYKDLDRCTWEEARVMCRQLHADCDLSQREAIQFIVRELVKQNAEMRAEVAIGRKEATVYLRPLDKNNVWGRIVLGLWEAFEVVLEPVPA